MTDFHAHVLPRMDDGSESVEESLRMLGEEARQGIDTVVATPHFYAEREAPDRFLRRRAESAQCLQPLLRRERGMPRLLLGAEVKYFEGMGGTEALDALAIGNTRLLLVEMPFRPWTERMIDELCGLRLRRDLQPVLAHIERYLDMQKADTLKRVLREGMLIQANAEFFLRRESSRYAMRLLQKGRIHLLGSDCHHFEKRPPNLGFALEEIGKKKKGGLLDLLEQTENELLRQEREGVTL